MPYVNILGVRLSAINMDCALEQMSVWINDRNQTYVVTCPVYTVMMCRKDAELRKIVNRAGIVAPDGMPLVFLSHLLGYKSVNRVYGPDLLLAFSKLAAQKGFTNYYYGGAASVPEKLAETLIRRFPGLRVAGTCSPPFRALTPQEDQAVIDQINAVNPDVVWVGLGSPKQDRWIAEHRDQLNAPVLVGVGAAFDFLTGRVPQAPYWMQRRALEWLFRLGTEPRRLWRRYIIYNPLFLLFIAMQITGLRQFPIDE